MSDSVHEAQSLCDDIKPLLAGRAPEVQGVVLCDLLALWIAGHANYLREPVLTAHIDAVRALVPLNELLLFGKGGHPGNAAPS